MRGILVCFLLGVGGCGSGSNGNDLSMPADLNINSLCGHPGDTGNVNGVGKYCTVSMDCANQPALICSTVMPIPQGPTYFCTLPCDPAAANPNAPCGAGATCTCLTAMLCGCVPDQCRIGLFG
jgi:hypothetical protein